MSEWTLTTESNKNNSMDITLRKQIDFEDLS